MHHINIYEPFFIHSVVLPDLSYLKHNQNLIILHCLLFHKDLFTYINLYLQDFQ